MTDKKTFLEELTTRIFLDFPGDLEEITLVFPNRRAGLFFAKALSRKITKPIWSPAIYSLEDFVYALTEMRPSDNLSLLLELYEVFTRETMFKEPFDRFYYWGDMLLKDFDEIDRNLIPAESLFTSLKNLKEIDAHFAFMSEEEKEALHRFWGNALGKKSKHKEAFIQFWSRLYPVYLAYHHALERSGKAYTGMIYRRLCRMLQNSQISWKKGKVIFAGFNALASSEELIIKWFVESAQGMIYWDLDSYYFDSPYHEAGHFLRQYYKDSIFRGTFPDRIPSFLKDQPKQIRTIASSQYSGQAMIAGDIIHNILHEQGQNAMEHTAIIFPDETLLPQVLYALPDNIGKTNITMGYPLSNSAFYSLFDHLLELHEKVREGSQNTWFYSRPVLNVLNHHFISGVTGDKAALLIREIEAKNMIYVSSSFLARDESLSKIFDPEAVNHLLDYLIRMLMLARRSFEEIEDEQHVFEKEFSIVFYRLLSRLEEIFKHKKIELSPGILKRVLKYYSQFEKVPFSGEPLEGLQMMGLMETRNLDFANVIILCSNDGLLPRTGTSNSFIPYNMRKAFGMPNMETQDAIYSYLFYRLLQRSRRVYLIYSTEESYVRQSEPSRYIHQLKFESGFEIQQQWLSMDINLTNIAPIVIEKDDFVMERLSRYCVDNDRRLSASALNTYMACPLNFYYKHVLDVSEESELSEDLDAAKFGNIVHFAMYDLYKPFEGKLLQTDHFSKIFRRRDEAILKSFAKYYGQHGVEDFKFEGKNILGREIIKKYITRILEIDKKTAPIRILGLEKRCLSEFNFEINGRTLKVGLKGIIDRIDMKDGVLRIIDYKSGRDESSFRDLPSLFDQEDDNRNKAIFQTFFYAMLFLNNNPEYRTVPVVSGLYNLRELYSENFDIRIKLKGKGGKGIVDDINLFMKDYMERLKMLISEIFDPMVPFRHRHDQDKCIYCEGLNMPSELNL